MFVTYFVSYLLLAYVLFHYYMYNSGLYVLGQLAEVVK